jgi:hypothetical protein
LFTQHPLGRPVPLSTGEVPTPYHVYDGYGAFVGGTADLDAVRRLLEPEQVTPVARSDGRALMGIWICDFTDASLGPHHELQLSIFVSRQPIGDVPPKPLALLEVLLTRPDVQMLCHGLWNNTPTVVAYNRELLDLDARLSRSTIADNGEALSFDVVDLATDSAVCSGNLSRPHETSGRASLAMLSQLGPRQLWQVARQPWVSLGVVNPAGGRQGRNAVARTFTKNDVNSVRFFDPQADSLTIASPRYQALGFTPLFVQHMRGFKFVYLNPE